MIRLEHIRKEYEAGTPLRDVSVEINRGDVIAVIGPSGTGKSTLLRMLNLLEEPSSGEIYLDGERITAPGYDKSSVRRKVGMVFQSYNLFEHLNVIENIMAGPVRLLGKSRQQAYDRGMELLDLVELSDRALSYPSSLSGGQKQRVSIARAIAMEPEIILFDEPTSALDPRMVQEVLRIIRKLADMGTTMMIVTHEMEFARAVSNRVFYMDNGGIEEDGKPEQVFDNPVSPRARAFLFREKKLETALKPDIYGYRAFQPELAEFCISNLLPAKLQYRVSSVLEELCMNCLAPHLGEDDPVRIELVWSGKDKSCRAALRYGGADLDPMDTEDELAKTLIQAECGSLRHSYDIGNTVEIVF